MPRKPAADGAKRKASEADTAAKTRAPVVIPRVFNFQADTVEAMRAHFKEHGYVVVRALQPYECERLIKRQVTAVWLKQPWTDRLEVLDPKTKAPLDIERDTEAYIEEFTRAGLDKATLERYKRAAPLHRGFAACCDPQVFHMPEVWAVRQDPRLYGLAAAIMGRRDLWVDINRSIEKLPGEGEEEFLHYDEPFLFLDWSEDEAGIGGKVVTNPRGATFVCVPGTNTLEAQAAIRALYRGIYPNAKPTDAKWALDPLKPDPLDLIGRRRSVQVPQGCAVFWSYALMHGVEKNPGDSGLKTGMYLGYLPAGARPEYKTKCGIDELEDRLGSYNEGRAPRLWPSLDEIHYFPKRFLNFPKILEGYIARTRPGWPGVKTRRLTTGDRVVGHLEPVIDPDYVPPPLSKLGERLLGKRAWHSA